MSKNLPTPARDPSGEVILYQAEDGATRIEVRLEGETVWLSQKAMAVSSSTLSKIRTTEPHSNELFCAKSCANASGKLG